MIKASAAEGAKPILVLKRYSELVHATSDNTYLKTVSTKIRAGLAEGFGLYVDAKARARPLAFHHVYEWGQVGSPSGRLFRISGTGHGDANFTIGYKLMPSSTPVPGGDDVFALKAEVMENAVTVTIRPRGRMLVFSTPGGDVFTAKPVVVKTPGGRAVAGSMASAFNSYFNESAINANPIYNSVINSASKEIERRAEMAARV